MGLVLLQFPAWVHPSAKTKDHILETKDKLAGQDLAVEFRHRSWLDEQAPRRHAAFSGDNGLTFVCVDEPQGFPSSVPPLAEATADMAYVRFHGRNATTWERRVSPPPTASTGTTRRKRWAQWVPRIEDLQQQTHSVHALINTNRGDQGPVNARFLAHLLQIPLPSDASAEGT